MHSFSGLYFTVSQDKWLPDVQSNTGKIVYDQIGRFPVGPEWVHICVEHLIGLNMIRSPRIYIYIYIPIIVSLL